MSMSRFWVFLLSAKKLVLRNNLPEIPQNLTYYILKFSFKTEHITFC